ncbi:hypothetical protein EV426DRAFT_703577 [Tirmania nivea]|nr:hypothetical protein EV426DRAFT_703577 [Tirmania nivea]
MSGMMDSTSNTEGPIKLLRGDNATGERFENRHYPNEDRLLDRGLPAPATTPHTPRHVLEGHDHRDRRHVPVSGPREDVSETGRANKIGVQQPQCTWDETCSPHSDLSPISVNTRFYLLDTESSAPHSRKTILWSIDAEHLIYNSWLIEAFIKFIQSYYPPPAQIGKYTLSFIVSDGEFPNEDCLQMLPREFVSYLVREPYNPTVEFQGKYGHVLTLPILNMGSGRMGKRLRVVYMVEYDPLAFEGPRTAHHGLRPYDNETPAFSPATVQLHHQKHSLDRPGVVHNRSVHINHKYVAVITVHILPGDDRLEKRVLRPPFDIDVEAQGNFSELYTKVEALISDAYAVSPHGRLSEIVGSRAIDVHLAYNTFVLPRHFAWNEKSFTEFDPQEKGGTWKLYLVAWIVEHPLGDPGGAPTGLPLPRNTVGWWRKGWTPPAPLDLREWKNGVSDNSGFQGSEKSKEPDSGLRPSSPARRGEYCAVRGDSRNEPETYRATPREIYQVRPKFSRELLPPLRPVEMGDSIDRGQWQNTNEGWGQEMQPGRFYESHGRTRASDWSYRQTYAEEYLEDENEGRRTERYREGFYIDTVPVRNHEAVQYYRGPDHGPHGPLTEHGPGEVWRHDGRTGERKLEIDYPRPVRAGSVTSDRSSNQGYSNIGVSEHRLAEGAHMGQSGVEPDHAGGHPGAQADNFTAQRGRDPNQLEARPTFGKRKREE